MTPERLKQILECDCFETTTHRVLMKTGNYHYRLQCPTCGNRPDNFVTKPRGIAVDSLPDYSHDLWDEWREAKRLHPELQQMPDYRGPTPEYSRYIQSETWRNRRREYLKNHPNCEVCGYFSEEVHHLSYERLGRERDEDLQALCKSCHEDKHPKQGEDHE